MKNEIKEMIDDLSPEELDTARKAIVAIADDANGSELLKQFLDALTATDALTAPADEPGEYFRARTFVALALLSETITRDCRFLAHFEEQFPVMLGTYLAKRHQVVPGKAAN